MANGMTMLLIGSVIAIGVFLNGVRFSRMTKSPWAGKSAFGMSVEGSDMPVSKVKLIGKIQMICAPVFLIFWTLLLFGVFGPVEGIQTIDLN